VPETTLQDYMSALASPDGVSQRSKFLIRFYYAGGVACFPYPYGYCKGDPDEPDLFRNKEECESECKTHTVNSFFNSEESRRPTRD